jgi:hypothetical protein
MHLSFNSYACEISAMKNVVDGFSACMKTLKTVGD